MLKSENPTGENMERFILRRVAATGSRVKSEANYNLLSDTVVNKQDSCFLLLAIILAYEHYLTTDYSCLTCESLPRSRTA